MSTILITLCFSFLVFFSYSVDAHRFNVGGNGVWIPNPIQSYQNWSGNTRFQIHDTIYFKYPKGSDSVEQVMKADFDGCNTRNPLKSYTDGETVIELKQSGPHYFISGNQDHCKKGQKVIVTVLSPRIPAAHSPAPSPSPANPPPTKSPSIAPATPPTKAQPPKSSSPATPPTKAQPPKSSSPVAPKKSPVTPATPPHGSASPPSSTTPAEVPKAEQVPSMAPTPRSHGFTAPAPSPKSSASGVTVMSVMTMLSTVAFTVFMFKV